MNSDGPVSGAASKSPASVYARENLGSDLVQHLRATAAELVLTIRMGEDVRDVTEKIEPAVQLENGLDIDRLARIAINAARDERIERSEITVRVVPMRADAESPAYIGDAQIAGARI